MKHLEGHGPPLIDEGEVGDHYKDLDNGEIYAKSLAGGWSNYARVDLHITIKQKSAWKRAAAGERLDDWAVKTLNAAANGGFDRQNAS